MVKKQQYLLALLNEPDIFTTYKVPITQKYHTLAYLVTKKHDLLALPSQQHGVITTSVFVLETKVLDR